MFNLFSDFCFPVLDSISSLMNQDQDTNPDPVDQSRIPLLHGGQPKYPSVNRPEVTSSRLEGSNRKTNRYTELKNNKKNVKKRYNGC